MKKKQLSIILLTGLILSSCGSTKPSSASDSTASAPTSEILTEAVTDIAAPAIEAIDCGGNDFTILSRASDEGYGFIYSEFFSEGETGEPVNDAVFRRNKKLEEKYNFHIKAEELNIGNLYEIVRSGNWTIDKLGELGRSVYQDLNGNADYDMQDRYGLVCSTFAWQPLYYGMNSSMIEKDEQDLPSLSWESERTMKNA